MSLVRCLCGRPVPSLSTKVCIRVGVCMNARIMMGSHIYMSPSEFTSPSSGRQVDQRQVKRGEKLLSRLRSRTAG